MDENIVKKAQIRRTIETHLDKELQYLDKGIKVSTLITTLEFGYRKRAAVLKTVARKGDIYKLFATRPP